MAERIYDETLRGAYGDVCWALCWQRSHLLLPSEIAFVHINADSNCSNLVSCTQNLRVINAENLTAPSVPLTAFPTGTPVLIGGPVWSKDFARLAFASTLNSAHSLEPIASLFTLNGDGTNLRQLTGGAPRTPLSTSTRTVSSSLGAAAINNVAGKVVLDGCSVIAQGVLGQGMCTLVGEAVGAFVINNVPVDSQWVFARGNAYYVDNVNNAMPAASTLAFGSASIPPGSNQVAVTMAPGFAFSLEPSWSRDGTRVFGVEEDVSFFPINCPGVYCQWQHGVGRFGQIVDLNTAALLARFGLDVSTITDTTLLSVIGTTNLFGCDWSAAQDRLACGLGQGLFPNVDEEDVNAVFLQNVVKWNPIHPGRLHRHRLDSMTHQPLR